MKKRHVIVGIIFGFVVMVVAGIYLPYLLYRQWAVSTAGDIGIGWSPDEVGSLYGEPDEIFLLDAGGDKQPIWTYYYDGVSTWPGIKEVSVSFWDGKVIRTSYTKYFSENTSQIVIEESASGGVRRYE